MKQLFPEYITLAEGGRVNVALQDGVTMAGARFTMAHVRLMTAGDILDAQEESERLVYLKGGDMALVMSPARMARESLRRQVARLSGHEGISEGAGEGAGGQEGKAVDHHGPLSAEELALFSAADLARIQGAAVLLDQGAALMLGQGAALMAGKAQESEKRGRADGHSGSAAPAAGPLA